MAESRNFFCSVGRRHADCQQRNLTPNQFFTRPAFVIRMRFFFSFVSSVFGKQRDAERWIPMGTATNHDTTLVNWYKKTNIKWRTAKTFRCWKYLIRICQLPIWMSVLCNTHIESEVWWERLKNKDMKKIKLFEYTEFTNRCTLNYGLYILIYSFLFSVVYAANASASSRCTPSTISQPNNLLNQLSSEEKEHSFTRLHTLAAWNW